MGSPFVPRGSARWGQIPIVVISVLFLMADQGLEAFQDLTPPKPLPGNRQPAYPKAALEAVIEGDVEFSARVTEQGQVESVEILKVPANRIGFENAVRDAVRSWRFDPARLGTVPTSGVYTGTVSFVLAGDLPTSMGRMYSRPSRQVWEELLKLLKEYRIKPEKLDQESQVAITRPQRFADERFNGLQDPGFPSHVEGEFQLHIFVSPFVEPARVYAGSVVDVRWPPPTRAQAAEHAVFYNTGNAETWIYERLEGRLGEQGKPIPISLRRRLALARSLGATEADVCSFPAAGAAGADPGEQRKPTAPERIKITDVTPIYPARSRRPRNEGQVFVKSLLLEDGALTQPVLIDPEPPDPEFASAAKGAVSLWRFRPGRLDGCPFAAPMTVTVTFSQR